jgi:hypothetical protein
MAPLSPGKQITLSHGWYHLQPRGEGRTWDGRMGVTRRRVYEVTIIYQKNLFISVIIVF